LSFVFKTIIIKGAEIYDSDKSYQSINPSFNPSFNLCIESFYFLHWYWFFVFRRSVIKLHSLSI